MPAPEGYFLIRIRSSEGFDKFRWYDLSKKAGIKVFLGIKSGKSEVIEYAFLKTKWTREEAQKWIDRHRKKD